MAVVSIIHSTKLPDELEHMIFLIASKQLLELAIYIWVARRVRAW